MRIGFVGCGNIGGIMARGVDRGDVRAAIAGLHDIDEAKARALRDSLVSSPPVLSLEDLIEASTLVIESTNPAVMPGLVRHTLQTGKDVMVLSVGGFIGHEDLFDLARARGHRIYVPSGAIPGVDAVRAAATAEVYEVRITTRKPPQSLSGSPGTKDRGIVLEGLTEPLLVFEGSAREAVHLFPVNVNVAATLSLAGIGPDRTEVRIIADPTVERNIHEIELEGDFGRLFMRAENVPSPDNPKTSYLAALSALALLRRITDVVEIGT